MSYEILEKLKQQIEGYKSEAKWEEIGTVIEAGDGIIKISGLSNVQSQEVLVVETGKEEIKAVALNLEEDAVGALLLGDATVVKSGQTVKRTKALLSIDVGDQLLGRVVDPLGNPMDGKGPIFSQKDKPQANPLENNAPDVLARQSVKQPLHTGIKAIDAMIPIGRGQRELIIGDLGTGKTAIALDMIINQGREGGKPAICIYVAVGQKESKIAKIVETLKNNNALEYTIVVVAGASSPAAWLYLAPFAGCAIGEYFRDKGQDALIIYD
ncbi:MAG TPA: ATPase domain-containing protein, partial [Negativicutes bacterium]|nr:ATPase domain-containing protein [Negativicutes bacterium]